MRKGAVSTRLDSFKSETEIKRKAVEVTAQLPQDTEEALRVLELAKKLLLEFVGR